MSHPIVTTVEDCANAGCVAGVIGQKSIRTPQWYVEVSRFEGKIDLWNELTKHNAIPHIGFIQPFKFCPDCGAPICHEANSPAKVIEAFSELLEHLYDMNGVELPEPLQQRIKAIAPWYRRAAHQHTSNHDG